MSPTNRWYFSVSKAQGEHELQEGNSVVVDAAPGEAPRAVGQAPAAFGKVSERTGLADH